MALLDLDFMELKQKVKEMSNPGYQNPEFKDFIQNEEERMKIDLPERMAEPYRPEEEEEEKEEIKHDQMEVDTIKTNKTGKKKS